MARGGFSGRNAGTVRLCRPPPAQPPTRRRRRRIVRRAGTAVGLPQLRCFWTFTWRHVRQLQSTARAFTVNLTRHCRLLAGGDQIVEHGCTMVRGLHFQVVTASTPLSAPVVEATWLRKGSDSSLLRRLHDATRGSSIADRCDVVCQRAWTWATGSRWPVAVRHQGTDRIGLRTQHRRAAMLSRNGKPRSPTLDCCRHAASSTLRDVCPDTRGSATEATEFIDTDRSGGRVQRTIGAPGAGRARVRTLRV